MNIKEIKKGTFITLKDKHEEYYLEVSNIKVIKDKIKIWSEKTYSFYNDGTYCNAYHFDEPYIFSNEDFNKRIFLTDTETINKIQNSFTKNNKQVITFSSSKKIEAKSQCNVISEKIKSEIETVEIKLEKDFLNKFLYNFFSGPELKKFNPKEFIPQITELVSMNLKSVLNRTKPYNYKNKPKSEEDKEGLEKWKEHMDSYSNNIKWNLRHDLSFSFSIPYTWQDEFNYFYNGKTIFEACADFYTDNGRHLTIEDKMFEDIVEIITTHVIDGLLQKKEWMKLQDLKKEEEKKKIKEYEFKARLKRNEELRQYYKREAENEIKNKNYVSPPVYVSSDSVEDTNNPWDCPATTPSKYELEKRFIRNLGIFTEDELRMHGC